VAHWLSLPPVRKGYSKSRTYHPNPRFEKITALFSFFSFYHFSQAIQLPVLQVQKRLRLLKQPDLRRPEPHDLHQQIIFLIQRRGHRRFARKPFDLLQFILSPQLAFRQQRPAATDIGPLAVAERSPESLKNSTCRSCFQCDRSQTPIEKCRLGTLTKTFRRSGAETIHIFNPHIPDGEMAEA
jgi:hypothetical protein